MPGRVPPVVARLNPAAGGAESHVAGPGVVVAGVVVDVAAASTVVTRAGETGPTGGGDRVTVVDWPIAEVARMPGGTARTLRHYDEIGLRPPTRIGANGHRGLRRRPRLEGRLRGRRTWPGRIPARRAIDVYATERLA